MVGNLSCFCCRLLTFFKITFSEILSGTLSESHTFGFSSGPTWVHTVCKGYQTTIVTASSERDYGGGVGIFCMPL